MFPCSRCGLCCRSLHRQDEYTDLDRGDGVCRHFETENNNCSIYENRPAKCRITDTYHAQFTAVMSLKDYMQWNAEACLAAQRSSGIPEHQWINVISIQSGE